MTESISNETPTETEIPDDFGWWYLSFAEESRWLGGCFVEAAGFIDAVKKAKDHQCNPGGEVAGWGPLEVDIKPEYANRLLVQEEAERARLEGVSRQVTSADPTATEQQDR